MSAPSMKTLRRVVLFASFLAAALAIVRIVDKSAASRPAGPRLEVYGEAPDFAFRDQTNAPYGKAQMLGHVSIANFIFTRCPTVCPVFTMKMQRVAEETGDGIELISFSVDPDYDTPERLAEYATKRHIDGSRWHFLTGDSKDMRDTVEGALKISMEVKGLDPDGVPDIVHGEHFVLFDHMGRIRGYYNSQDADRIQTMIKDASWLAKQVSQK